MEYRHERWKNPHPDYSQLTNEWPYNQHDLYDACEFGYSAAVEHILSLLKEKAPSSVIIDILIQV